MRLIRFLAALALFATPVMAAEQGQLVQHLAFASKHVAARQISIWLPPGYAQSRERLPVIYMHDGQNIFEPGRSYGGQEWGVDEALLAMKRRAIVVGIWNTGLRGREYFPEKVFNTLPPDHQANAVTTHGGKPLSDAYLRLLVTELKPFVDRTYRTRKGARDTGIMGSSMGGLISLYAMAEYPRIFGAAACLSTHWPLSDPAKSSPEVVAATFRTYLAGTGLQPGRNRLYTDHGTLNLDGYYRPYSERVEAFMPALGWRRDRNWVSRVFEGTDHNEAAWRARRCAADIPARPPLTAAQRGAGAGWALFAGGASGCGISSISAASFSAAASLLVTPSTPASPGDPHAASAIKAKGIVARIVA